MTDSIGNRRRIGVCSWSLRPATARELAARVAECGVGHVQLALGPIRSGAMPLGALRDALAAARVTACSGMMSTVGEDYSSLASIARTGGIRPDVHWAANVAIAKADARLARELGLPLVTFHAGFLPHGADDPERAKLLVRLRTIVDVFADEGVRLGFETGQETAATLLEFLSDLDRTRAGVNFDPANMILYGMGDPVAALRELGPRVVQVHVKDALPAARRGEWGEEVPVGTGMVDWRAFFAALDAVQPGVDLMIEREAGEQRVDDVRRARSLVASLTGAAV
ncbi:MAG: sugar phosphate isomerase/epimerase [Planctomycetota bacterium]|nr:sugar phosphate isomerase/epimerase [Planctomycetota bacterium]